MSRARSRSVASRCASRWAGSTSTVMGRQVRIGPTSRSTASRGMPRPEAVTPKPTVTGPPVPATRYSSSAHTACRTLEPDTARVPAQRCSRPASAALRRASARPQPLCRVAGPGRAGSSTGRPDGSDRVKKSRAAAGSWRSSQRARSRMSGLRSPPGSTPPAR